VSASTHNQALSAILFLYREALAVELPSGKSTKPPCWHGACMTEGMKQMSLDTTGFERKTKHTRKREFLDEMSLVVPWSELVALITPHGPSRGAKGGRPPFGVDTLLRIHFLQWFNLSDQAMEESLYDTAMFRQFAGLDIGEDHLPDESTILRFRHLLEEHQWAEQILATISATLTDKGLLLKQGTVVDATLIAARRSTKNQDRERYPEMHQTKKGMALRHEGPWWSGCRLGPGSKCGDRGSQRPQRNTGPGFAA